MKTRTITAIAITITVLVAVLGATMWSLQPEKSAAWAVSIFFLPAAWVFVLLATRLSVKKSCGTKTFRELTKAIVLAGVLLALSLGAAIAKELELVQGDFTERFMGVVFGVLLIGMGNVLPKKLTPRADSSCNPAKTQAVQRFVGWLFVIAGLLYAGVWIVVDLENTGLATLLTFPAALVLIIVTRVSYLRMIGTRRSTEASA